MSRCAGVQIFELHGEDGHVNFDYKTRVYFGRFAVITFWRRYLSDEKSFHMTPDEFPPLRSCRGGLDRRLYQSRVESFPVLSQVKPGQIRAALPKILRAKERISTRS